MFIDGFGEFLNVHFEPFLPMHRRPGSGQKSKWAIFFRFLWPKQLHVFKIQVFTHSILEFLPL